MFVLITKILSGAFNQGSDCRREEDGWEFGWMDEWTEEGHRRSVVGCREEAESGRLRTVGWLDGWMDGARVAEMLECISVVGRRWADAGNAGMLECWHAGIGEGQREKVALVQSMAVIPETGLPSNAIHGYAARAVLQMQSGPDTLVQRCSGVCFCPVPDIHEWRYCENRSWLSGNAAIAWK